MSGRRRNDRSMLAAAVVLLLAPAIGWMMLSASAHTRREATLASVPAFPVRGQGRTEGATTSGTAPRPPQAASAPRSPPPPRPAPTATDPLAPFLASRSEDIWLVQMNALFNTPLFERLKECIPDDIEDAEKEALSRGYDITRDIDRIALVPGGRVMSGFFAGKPIAEAMMRSQEGVSAQEYRGATIFRTESTCRAQLGNLILAADAAAGCEALVDRALDSRPSEDDVADVYGDVFYRVGSETVARMLLELKGGENEIYGTLLRNVSGLTVRANVWDAVALSVEAEPTSGTNAFALASMARAAIRLARTQIDNDDVELQTFASLASVADRSDRLEVQVALPAKDLFDKVLFPCPGRRSRDGGTP